MEIKNIGIRTPPDGQKHAVDLNFMRLAPHARPDFQRLDHLEALIADDLGLAENLDVFQAGQEGCVGGIHFGHSAAINQNNPVGNPGQSQDMLGGGVVTADNRQSGILIAVQRTVADRAKINAFHGRHIYEKWVKPSRVDLKKAAAHYAISSFFEDYPEKVSIYCFSIENLDNRSAEAGRAKIAVGRAQITSQITREVELFHYAVFHMGDHSISCGISTFEEEAYSRMAVEILGVFDKSDIPGVFRCFGNYFHDATYSLTSLFRDEQRKVLNSILETTTSGALMLYRQLYDNHIALMRFINDSSSQIPKALYVAGDIVVNSDLNQEFDREILSYDAIRALIEDAERAGIDLDAETLEFTLRRNLERLALELHLHPENLDLLERLAQGIELAAELPFSVRFQEIENIHYSLGQEKYPVYQAKAEGGDDEARQWTATFLRLAKVLKIRMN